MRWTQNFIKMQINDITKQLFFVAIFSQRRKLCTDLYSDASILWYSGLSTLRLVLWVTLLYAIMRYRQVLLNLIVALTNQMSLSQVSSRKQSSVTSNKLSSWRQRSWKQRSDTAGLTKISHKALTLNICETQFPLQKEVEKILCVFILYLLFHSYRFSSEPIIPDI